MSNSALMSGRATAIIVEFNGIRAAASAAEEMSSATEELSNLAAQMQRLVERFELDDQARQGTPKAPREGEAGEPELQLVEGPTDQATGRVTGDLPSEPLDEELSPDGHEEGHLPSELLDTDSPSNGSNEESGIELIRKVNGTSGPSTN